MPVSRIARSMVTLPDLWVGVNFWSRAGGPFMWRDFDEAVVREELQTLVDHSLNVTRSFFFWPDFHPEPYQIDESKCAAFARFLDLHTELGLTTIPTFIVGHMSGQNWDPSWRGGRNLYSDVWMVGRQAWFISEMVRRFHAHPAVAGWLISNEMPLYGGGGGLMGPVEDVDGDAIRSWSELMVAAVRAAGGTQAVSLGDGAWGSEVMGADNGFRLTWTAPLVDWLGPHSYHMNDDQLRQNLIPAFNAELCSLFGRPVVLEEFGVSSSFVSDANAADYYRQVLHSTLAAGVTGWLAWNNTDFDLDDIEPYNHRPFELSFGLTTVDGRPKAALKELSAFSESVRSIDLLSCHRPDTGVGIVVSGYLDGDFPFWGEDESPAIRDSVLTAYIAAKLADLSPALIRDSAELPPAPLLIVPSAKAVTAPGCRALVRAAEAGSTVWVSYSVGETLNQRGWWWPNADATFGIRTLSRYGLAEPARGAVVTLTFESDFGGIVSGSTLELPVGGSEIARSVLPLETAGATVVARDAFGAPAIVMRETGAGRLILCTYPVELFIARTPFADQSGLAQLYVALARVAGAEPELTSSDVHTMVDRIVSSEGNEFAIVVNATPDVRRIQLRQRGGYVVDEIELAPLGARIIRVPHGHESPVPTNNLVSTAP